MRHFPYLSTKTYGHDLGLSCCFRQHRATHSHCSLLHGYALSFKFVFGATDLDSNNWVADFGNLKELKAALQHDFDHTMAVAWDDPQMDMICDELGGFADVRVFEEGVGCEMFARRAYKLAEKIVLNLMGDRVQVVSCECAEHGANSAIYQPNL